MFGDQVSLLDALLITVFSMTVVFISLLAISYIVDLTRIVIEKFQSKSKDSGSKVNAPQPEIDEIEEVEEAEDDTEIVAVITAAVACMMGTSSDGLIVRNIKRIQDSDPAWSKVGRTQLMR